MPGRHPAGPDDRARPAALGGGLPAPDNTTPVPALLAGRTVAVGRDAAFCFTYAANLQTLEQLGARVVFFSPLDDAALPECDAVWLPGGYPELHTDRIAANTGMKASLMAHVLQRKPCGPSAAA